MPTELAVREKVELSIPTPILDTINHSLAELFKKNLAEIVDETNRGIELGVTTDENAASAESAVQQARKTASVIEEIRKQYTRPIDAGKKKLMDEVKRMLKPLNDSLEILDGMVLDRARKIEAAKEKARREAEEAQRRAEEEARKREEWNRNISLSKGGNGEVKPVEPEQVITPVSQIGMRSTTRTRSIPDLEAIQKAVDEGVRQIIGVRIYPVWKFTVEDAKSVPKEYRRLVRG